MDIEVNPIIAKFNELGREDQWSEVQAWIDAAQAWLDGDYTFTYDNATADAIGLVIYDLALTGEGHRLEDVVSEALDLLRFRQDDLSENAAHCEGCGHEVFLDDGYCPADDRHDVSGSDL